MRRLGLYALIGVALLAVGCGSASSDGEKNRSASASAASTPPAVEQAKVERAVRQWVDKDDCSMMSDRYAAEGVGSAAEGQRQCELATQANPGLQAGQYSISRVSVTDQSAEVRLALKPAGYRTYTLVRGGRLGWEIDGRSEQLVGNVGDTFPYRDSFELDGRQVFPYVEITVLSVKDPARPNANPYVVKNVEKARHRFVRTRIRLKSLGKESFGFSTYDFKAVDEQGQRYDPDSQVFEPALGNGSVDLTNGDKATGYLGFQLPDKAKLTEIRFSGASSDDPIIWKVK